MKGFHRQRSSEETLSHTRTPVPHGQSRWHDFWGEARTRILVWYIVILALSFGIAIPAFRQLLFARVDARFREDMAGELQDFKELLSGTVDLAKLENNRIRDNAQNTSRGNQPLSDSEKQLIQDLQIPSNTEETKRFFDAYLSVEIPEDNIFFITFVDGEFYDSSPKALPEDLKPGSALMRQFSTQSEPGQGQQESKNRDINRFSYLVEPVKPNGQHLGSLVIVHSAEEHAEILEAVTVIIQVAVVVLLIALWLVWFAAGRILQPLQSLATTAQSISGTDLKQRIPIQGKGELAKLAAIFNEMMDRLESSFVSQRNFINDAGHELRTPITIMRGHLELIGDSPAEQQETLAVVMDELDRMGSFVEDLILLARSERPDFLQLEVVDAAAITHEIFDQAQALAPRHWQLETVTKGQIVVDRQRLTQALMQLVHNAIQYTATTDFIRLGSAIRQGNIHFWVQDNGEGIAPENQQRIFGRFARVSDHRRRSEGAGLGLSIVQAIAQAHGGEVSLHSQVGVGSTFTLILPLDAV